MKCPSCGHENLEGYDFCENCLVSLVNSSSTPRFLKSDVLKDPLKNAELRVSPIVKPSATVREAIRAMKEKKMGCLLIVNKQELVGIFTERDLLQKLSFPDDDLDGIKIKEVMTPAPEVLDEEQRISAVLNKMSMGNFRHVPIRKEDGSFTYFSVRDALQYLF
jgi:CBS domain-containing protein